MVNNKSRRNSEILEILETSGTAVSGEQIAKLLNISRVAVWKKINSLRDLGYTIESSPTGYKLTSGSDKPLPWEIDADGSDVEYFSSIESTMKKAFTAAESGCEDGTIIIAETQTEGKTADGGTWHSPEGGLYITRIRTRPYPSAYNGLYNIAVCGITAGLLRDEFKIDTEIIWPSGIAAPADGGKIGGVLTEHRGRNGMTEYAAAGIGLNINTPAEELPSGAVSLKSLAGRAFSVKDITAKIIRSLEVFDAHFPQNYAEVLKQCRVHISVMNKRVSAAWPDGNILNGIINGLNADGSLTLNHECEDHKIYPGVKIDYE